MTKRHSRVMKTRRMATFRDVIKESGWVLPHPGACLTRDTSTIIRGWPMHYPDVHSGGMLGYRLTWRPTKLLCLWDPINLVCANT
jgi:hypothetical protein